MAKSTRRRTKKATRTPRQPKIQNANSLTAEQHLRHSVFALLHQSSHSTSSTIEDTAYVVHYILHDSLPAPFMKEDVPAPKPKQKHSTMATAFPEPAANGVPEGEHPHRKHFDVENLDL